MDYFDALRKKAVTVVGLGVSNEPLVKLLLSHDAAVTICDKNDNIDRTYWESMGVKLSLGERYMDGLGGDIVLRTPGLRPDHPSLLSAKAAGSEITSETELFFKFCPCPIFAITGSDGKSTTTTVIAEMLRAAGHTVHLGGNLGTPLLPIVNSIMPSDYAVLELSSFQLMSFTQSPHVAVVTNVTPNHLDWHTGMDEYIAAKQRLLDFQGENDIAVLNSGNEITSHIPSKGIRRMFSHSDVKNGVLYDILPISDIKIRGQHNIENYMAAVLAVKDIVPADAIRQVAQTFNGVPHRNQLVHTKDGVSFYNDSIGSSPTRTIASLYSHTAPVVLIAGGYDKNIPYEPLAEALPGHVKAVVLMGKTAGKIRSAIENVSKDIPLIDASSMADAVDKATSAACKGDVVLLSPASASFDMFKNFEERGNMFVELVKK